MWLKKLSRCRVMCGIARRSRARSGFESGKSLLNGREHGAQQLAIVRVSLPGDHQ